MSERERGPFEREMHEFIRVRGLADPFAMNAEAAGRELTDTERINVAWRMNMVMMEAILRVAREVDDLRAGL